MYRASVVAEISTMDDLLKYWALRVARVLLWLLETISDLVLGWTFSGGTREERRNAENYENSAQVVTVVHKAKETLYKWTVLDNFLYRHDKYVHPNYVLKNKNSYLLAVERDYALFGMTSDPDIDIYNTKDYPFLFLFQYTMADKLVIMPIESFHRLAGELGDPKVPVAITAMTARCGSTLLAQVFNR